MNILINNFNFVQQLQTSDNILLYKILQKLSQPLYYHFSKYINLFSYIT
jgi:hypothetical protein